MPVPEVEMAAVKKRREMTPVFAPYIATSNNSLLPLPLPTFSSPFPPCPSPPATAAATTVNLTIFRAHPRKPQLIQIGRDQVLPLADFINIIRIIKTDVGCTGITADGKTYTFDGIRVSLLVEAMREAGTKFDTDYYK